MSSCFSRCLRVPIAIRAFYESYLWILQTLLLTHPDLHPGLLGTEDKMTQRHDIFVRAYAVATDEANKQPKSYSIDFPKWPRLVLLFDTETRITADQSLTFGVFRLCELKNDQYKLIREGLLYADDLPATERKILENYARTA